MAASFAPFTSIVHPKMFLTDPPSLDMLAAEVGCSSFYLSRLFVQQTGMSIPGYLRTNRLEKAGILLQSGKMNVTEAAMAVGYSSLGSFNKAFAAHFGCCPGLYPHARSLLKARLPLRSPSSGASAR